MNKIEFEELFFSKTSDYLDVYLPKQMRRSKYTIESYRDALTVFRRFLPQKGFTIKTFKFSDCTRDFILCFMEHMQKNGLSNASCNQRLATIKSYLWYVADGNITWQQTALSISKVPFLKNPEKNRETLSEECLKALMLAPGNGKTGIRDTTILVILYDSAIRLSELIGLKVCDVELSKSTPHLRIHGKGDKERIVSITEGTVAHIKRYIGLYHKGENIGQEPLFYTIIHGRLGHMSSGNVQRIIDKYAEIIRPDHPDLPAKVHPHMFRRTRATNLYQDNVPLELVSRILGHASTQTTRIYAKPSLEMMKEAMDSSGNKIDPEEQLWPDDEQELLKLFGIR